MYLNQLKSVAVVLIKKTWSGQCEEIVGFQLMNTTDDISFHDGKIVEFNPNSLGFNRMRLKFKNAKPIRHLHIQSPLSYDITAQFFITIREVETKRKHIMLRRPLRLTECLLCQRRYPNDSTRSGMHVRVNLIRNGISSWCVRLQSSMWQPQLRQQATPR